jgi:hypothetical protein
MEAPIPLPGEQAARLLLGLVCLRVEAQDREGRQPEGDGRHEEPAGHS